MAFASDEIGEQVESLLTQLARQGGKRAAATAEDLIRVLVDYYGSGLARIVEMVVAADPALLPTLAMDPLVESQLILHGLHPLDVDSRIEQALDKVRPYLGSHAGGVAYLGVDEVGVAHLRLDGSCHGCPSSTVTVRMTIEEAVLKAAPEVAGIEVEGQAAPPERLLQIGRGPGLDAALPGTRWRAVPAAELPEVGQFGGVSVDRAHLLVCRLADSFYAYADFCPTCGARMSEAGSRLTAQTLQCGACTAAYDVRLAGKAQDGTGRHLAPFPLLDDEAGVRVALPEEVVV
jgi:Fe-S cluster biogenesis protein NfuA/nitrite reductase/ring-hydroxylating ferredoxin subunit